jgi:hypothetical protein
MLDLESFSDGVERGGGGVGAGRRGGGGRGGSSYLFVTEREF